MDTLTLDNITRILKQYRSAVDTARRFSGELRAPGNIPAGAPYFARALASRSLGEWTGSEPLPQEFSDEYNQITADLANLECEGGRPFREELFRDLGVYVEAYRTLLWFRELGMEGAEDIEGINLRDAIGVLLDELEGEFPTEEIHIMISCLDSEYRRCFEECDEAGIAKWQNQVSAVKSGKRTGTP